jgi:hypothetical protein
LSRFKLAGDFSLVLALCNALSVFAMLNMQVVLKLLFDL